MIPNDLLSGNPASASSRPNDRSNRKQACCVAAVGWARQSYVDLLASPPSYNSVLSDGCPQDELPTLIKKVAFEDFEKNAFQITISQVQALALKKAGERVPCPADQLALVTKKREKKKKGRTAYP